MDCLPSTRVGVWHSFYTTVHIQELWLLESDGLGVYNWYLKVFSALLYFYKSACSAYVMSACDFQKCLFFIFLQSLKLDILCFIQWPCADALTILTFCKSHICSQRMDTWEHSAAVHVKHCCVMVDFCHTLGLLKVTGRWKKQTDYVTPVFCRKIKAEAISLIAWELNGMEPSKLNCGVTWLKAVMWKYNFMQELILYLCRKCLCWGIREHLHQMFMKTPL